MIKWILCSIKNHDVKTYGRMEVQLHAFLALSATLMWMVRFTLRPIYSRGKTPLPIE
jgi:hypothetical protein